MIDIRVRHAVPRPRVALGLLFAIAGLIGGAAASAASATTQASALPATGQNAHLTDTKEQAIPAAVTAASPIGCAAGQSPLLRIDTFPGASTTGAPTPEAAVRAIFGPTGDLTFAPMGKQPTAPVWVGAGSETFVATILADGSWFASRASFVSCYAPQPKNGRLTVTGG